MFCPFYSESGRGAGRRGKAGSKAKPKNEKKKKKVMGGGKVRVMGFFEWVWVCEDGTAMLVWACDTPLT